MILDVENCYVIVYLKKVNMFKFEYFRLFGVIMKESVKCVISWVVYYYISWKFWYLKFDIMVFFYNVLLMMLLFVVNFFVSDCDFLCNWVLIYGVVVR